DIAAIRGQPSEKPVSDTTPDDGRGPHCLRILLRRGGRWKTIPDQYSGQGGGAGGLRNLGAKLASRNRSPQMSPETIAHYRITGKLGNSGMGAVYRAVDTKLKREMAVKTISRFLRSRPR